jgi:hypothetical protein
MKRLAVLSSVLLLVVLAGCAPKDVRVAGTVISRTVYENATSRQVRVHVVVTGFEKGESCSGIPYVGTTVNVDAPPNLDPKVDEAVSMVCKCVSFYSFTTTCNLQP